MARDRQVPGSGLLSSVHPTTGTPVGACVLVALMAALFLLKYAGVAYIAIAASGMIYLSYVLANLAILRARRRGFPRTPGAFSLGRWGMPINILALVWGGSMLINFAWHRVATNPKPSEIPGLSFPGFLDDIPILWLVLGFVLVLGVIYYGIRHRQIPEPKIPEAAQAEVV